MMMNVNVDLLVRFEEDNGQRKMVVKVDDNKPVISQYYEPRDYSSVDLEEFEGSYYSEELGTSYSITVEEENLNAIHLRTGSIKLNPVMKDFFIGNRWYFSNLKFIRNSYDKIIGLSVSSGRVRDLWFERKE